MVEAVRNGRSHHDVAREFHVSPSTVHHWVHHAHGQRLDRVDWSDRSRLPRTIQRTQATIEDLVLEVRRHLQTTSDLGCHGAATIRQALGEHGIQSPPSVRTINRILRRRGVLDGQRRGRRPPPPPGWFLPQVAARRHELDSVDVVEGLVIKGGPRVEVLNAVSLHGGLVASWPVPAGVTAKLVVDCLVERWREFGLPGYAQFDNDTIFQGTHAHRDAVGRVSRLCLGLGVVPVFVPPREPGFQAAIERYNGSWQGKVWSRFEHDDLSGLQDRSRRHVTALRRHRADRVESAPSRREFPERWSLDLQARLKGRIVYLRRTDATGAVEVLGRNFEGDPHWTHRLVRAEGDLDGGMVRFSRLRRREPRDQPMMREVIHRIKHKILYE